MSIYALADLHLSYGVPNKTMNIFGSKWEQYHEKIDENWKNIIKEEDTILIPRRYIVGA